MHIEILNIALHVVLLGLIYSFVVMGVYLSSRVIKFDDLTTEGSFGLGGAVTAIMLYSGYSCYLAMPLAVFAGSLAGALTGLLHTKLKMNNLICGLVVTTGLFSVCLKLAKANLTLPATSSIFMDISPLYAVAFILLLVIIVYQVVRLLLLSEVGLLLKALATNPQMLVNLGKSVHGYKILGLAIANALIALSGSLLVQTNGYFSITGNVGTLVIGLAGLILAEMIKPAFGMSLIFGAILYQAIFACTIELELEPMWNNLIKAVLIVILIQIKPRKAFVEAR